MRIEQDYYRQRMIYSAFSSMQPEDGVYKLTLKGGEAKVPIPIPEAVIAFYPNGLAAPLLLTSYRFALEDYCHEIMELEVDKTSSDNRQQDSLLKTLYMGTLAVGGLPQAMLTFFTDSTGRKIDLHSVVGLSPQSALNHFKNYSEQILGIE